MKKINKTALSAILAALATVIMYVGSIFGKIDIATAVAASLCVMIAQGELGYRRAIAVYLITAALSFVLVPSKTSTVLFAVMFGMYPVLKSYCEARFAKKTAYAVKYVYLNVAVGVLLVLAGVFSDVIPWWIYGAVALAANIMFPVYDFLLSRIMAVYYCRIRKNLF